MQLVRQERGAAAVRAAIVLKDMGEEGTGMLQRCLPGKPTLTRALRPRERPLLRAAHAARVAAVVGGSGGAPCRALCVLRMPRRAARSRR
jgi:hypothetical protein